MIIVSESAAALKGFLANTGLNQLARTMLLRVVLAFIMHRGRMSCSAAAGSIAAESIHRGELTRFLARPRWQRHDFNNPLMKLLLAKETNRGKFLFLIDATLISQVGKKTQNTYSTGNRGRNPAKGRRYNKKKVVYKRVHNFTFGLLITPSGMDYAIMRPSDIVEMSAAGKARDSQPGSQPGVRPSSTGWPCGPRCPRTCRHRGHRPAAQSSARSRRSRDRPG